jgi:hypothetical protein
MAPAICIQPLSSGVAIERTPHAHKLVIHKGIHWIQNESAHSLWAPLLVRTL